MHTVRQISLSGYPGKFQLNEDAYEALAQYLERARLQLTQEADHEEVLRDLEQSIGEKLAARRRSADQVLALAEVNAVLAEVGPVETGSSQAPAAPARPRGRRRLYRIQEGQNIWGVCQGLAAYSNIPVDWVRTIFVLLSLATGGVFVLVYVILAFVMPVVPTHAAYLALHNAVPNAS
jgi:phage shock protein PspC (stress-responsive transcriptional regulator)